jgi:hypothetical protein
VSAHEFYAARAAEARADAEAASLANVRDLCLRSAAAWDAMASRALYTEKLREKREAEKAAEQGEGVEESTS